MRFKTLLPDWFAYVEEEEAERLAAEQYRKWLEEGGHVIVWPDDPA